MKKTLSILTIIAMLFTLAACSTDTTKTPGNEEIENNLAYVDDGSSQENVSYDVDDVKSKIDVKTIPTIDGQMCVFITNNSETIIDELEVQVNYKNSQGMIIDTDSDGHDMILPGYTVVSRLDIPGSYDSFDTNCSIELGVNPNYINHSEFVEVSANKGEDCIIVQIENKSKVTIDEIEYAVVLYKGNNIVSITYPNDITDVKTGEVIVEKETLFGEDYDKFEVYLNQAHTFEF